MNVLETKNMNRQQRRQAKKHLEWINSLSSAKQKLIGEVVEDRAKSKALKLLENTIEQVGISVSASLIKNYDEIKEELTMKRIVGILKDFEDNLSENIEFEFKNGESWKMKIKELEPKLVERIEGLLEEKMTQKKIIEMMKKEFTELTSSHIRNAFQQAKENVKARKEEAKKEEKRKEDLTTDEALNYIFADEVDQEEIKEVKEEKEEIEDMKINGKVIPKKLEVKGIEPVETDIKGLLSNKLNQKQEDVERMTKELKELELKLGKNIVDVEKLQQALELLSDIEF